MRSYKDAAFSASRPMDLDSFDFFDARNRMVDSQIRPNRVVDPRILAAMREIPRERFLPPELRAFAYVDEDVALGNGRVLMEPMVIARLVQLAAPTAGERALVIAAGVGYGAALLSACGVRVIALEEDRGLAGFAERALSELAPSVSLVHGPLATGWPSGAPFDLIVIEGAVQEIPRGLERQLRADRGRLVTVRTVATGVCQAVLADPTPVGLRAQPIFDCATAPIRSLMPKPGFTF
jgi:protein-L-isoaspartate(D-aspartate) O-methyltransferase